MLHDARLSAVRQVAKRVWINFICQPQCEHHNPHLFLKLLNPLFREGCAEEHRRH